MSRNSSGTYSLPAGQPVVNGTTISVTPFNTLTADLASEITDSLDRSGKGGMIAGLQIIDGDQDGPGVHFTSDTTGGLYYSGGVVVAVNAAPIATFSATGLAVTGKISATAQTITTTAMSLAGTWTGTVKRWTDSLTAQVNLAGSAITGAAATDTPMTLPVGSRPSTLRRFCIAKMIGGVVTAGAVTIDTDGSVRIETGVTSGTTYYFEISFLPSP